MGIRPRVAEAGQRAFEPVLRGAGGATICNPRRVQATAPPPHLPRKERRHATRRTRLTQWHRSEGTVAVQCRSFSLATGCRRPEIRSDVEAEVGQPTWTCPHCGHLHQCRMMCEGLYRAPPHTGSAVAAQEVVPTRQEHPGQLRWARRALAASGESSHAPDIWESVVALALSGHCPFLVRSLSWLALWLVFIVQERFDNN